jgi:hypothetical protein
MKKDGVSFSLILEGFYYVVICDGKLWRSVREASFAMYSWNMNSEFVIWKRKTTENLILLTSLKDSPETQISCYPKGSCGTVCGCISFLKCGHVCGLHKLISIHTFE